MDPISRFGGYISTAEADPENRVSLGGPGGFRVPVPPLQGQEGPDPLDRYGQYRSLFHGRMVFGPQPKRFAATTTLFLLILVLQLLQMKHVERSCGPLTVAFGLLITTLCFIFYLAICISDPGVIPQNYRLSELISETNGYRRRNPGARFYRYCRHCRGFRPPRSKHCNTCCICIRDHETHLLMGGTCVGQRTTRSLLMLSLTVGLLTTYLFITNLTVLIQSNEAAHALTYRKGLALISLCLGLCLLCTPQLGLMIFVFRLYLILEGHTASSFLTRKRDWLTSPVDNKPRPKRFLLYVFGRRLPSIFVKKNAQVSPEDVEAANWAEWESLISLDAQGMELLDDLLLLRRREEERALEDWLNNNANQPPPFSPRPPLLPSEEFPFPLEFGRPKIIPSDPQVTSQELEALPPLLVRKKVRAAGNFPEDLSRRLEEYKKLRGKERLLFASNPEASSPSPFPPPSQSDGALALTPVVPLHEREARERLLLSEARAAQFTHLVQMVLTQDRVGLSTMSRRLNLAALLGIQPGAIAPDPDNFQFVELTNGLPLLTPRRELAQRGGGNRFTGQFGVPQMVAAGLLPRARELAQELEDRIGGGGRVRRIPNPLTNRVVYQAEGLRGRGPWVMDRLRRAQSRRGYLDINRNEVILDEDSDVGRASSRHSHSRVFSPRRPS